MSAPDSVLQGQKPAEVLIVGFGAVGIIYGYFLELHKLARVTAVARSTYDSIIKDGITIKSLKWGDIQGWRPSRVVRAIDELLDSPFDYVIISTKAIPEVATTPHLLGSLLSDQYRHPQPAYVLLQNGLGVEKELHDTLAGIQPPPIIITCALYIMTNITANGSVSHGSFERVTAGIYHPIPKPNTDIEQKVLERFVGLITSSNSEGKISDNVLAAKYLKNLWNSTFGMYSVLTNLSPLQWMQNDKGFEYSRNVILSLLREVILVGQQSGLQADWPDAEEFTDKAFDQFRTGTDFIPSALLDVRLGKPFELEVILGAVVRMGREHAVPIPRLELMYQTLYLVQSDKLRNSLAASK